MAPAILKKDLRFRNNEVKTVKTLTRRRSDNALNLYFNSKNMNENFHTLFRKTSLQVGRSRTAILNQNISVNNNSINSSVNNSNSNSKNSSNSNSKSNSKNNSNSNSKNNSNNNSIHLKSKSTDRYENKNNKAIEIEILNEKLKNLKDYKTDHPNENKRLTLSQLNSEMSMASIDKSSTDLLQNRDQELKVDLIGTEKRSTFVKRNSLHFSLDPKIGRAHV